VYKKIKCALFNYHMQGKKKKKKMKNMKGKKYKIIKKRRHPSAIIFY
jgi:hypothetical protein